MILIITFDQVSIVIAFASIITDENAVNIITNMMMLDQFGKHCRDRVRVLKNNLTEIRTPKVTKSIFAYLHCYFFFSFFLVRLGKLMGEGQLNLCLSEFKPL